MSIWTTRQEQIIRKLYPVATRQEILAALPNRNWRSIVMRASDLKVRRECWYKPPQRMKVVNELVALRKAKGMTQDSLALESGLNRGLIARIERGHNVPNLTTLERWCAGLSVDLAFVDRSKSE